MAAKVKRSIKSECSFICCNQWDVDPLLFLLYIIHHVQTFTLVHSLRSLVYYV